MNNNNNNASFPSSVLSPSSLSLPYLSGGVPPVGVHGVDFIYLYKSLDRGGIKLFKRIYKVVWRYLFPLSRVHTLSQVCVLPGVLVQFSITFAAFNALSWCWILTGSGKYAFNLANYSPERADYQFIRNFVVRGFLVRSHHDLSLPYSLRLRQPSWLSFSGAGVVFYKKILKAHHKALNHVYTNMIPHDNKKPIRLR